MPHAGAAEAAGLAQNDIARACRHERWARQASPWRVVRDRILDKLVGPRANGDHSEGKLLGEPGGR